MDDEVVDSVIGDTRFVYVCIKPERNPSFQVLSNASALSSHYSHVLVSSLTGPELGNAVANVTKENVSCGAFWEIASHGETFGVRRVPPQTNLYPLCGVEYCGETSLTDGAIERHG